MALTQITTDGIKDGTITGTDLHTNVDLVDNQKLRLGTGNDLQIYHNGSSFIQNYMNDLKIQSSGTLRNLANYVAIQNQTQTETMAFFQANNSVDLYYDNSKKFETTSDGVTVQSSNFCVLEVRCTTQDAILRLTSHNNDDTDWAIQNDQSQSNNLDFRFNNTTKMHLTSGGDLHIVGNLDLEDNDKLLLGTGDDLQIFHDGTDSRINNSTGALQITSNNDFRLKTNGGQNIFKATGNAVELYYDTGSGGSSKKFETTSYGAKFTDNVLFNNPDTTGRNLTWEADNDALHWEDNTKATFGASQDLQIYHDGTNSNLKNTTGTLYVAGDVVTLTNSAISELYFKGTANGAVELYYDNSKKFETTSDGATVSGDLTIDGSTPELRMKVTGDEQSHRIRFFNAADSMVARIFGDPSTGNLSLQTGGNGAEEAVKCIADGSVELYYDNNKKFETTSSGIDVTGNITVSGTVDGVDIAALSTSNATKMPSAGGTFGGNLITRFIVPDNDSQRDLGTTSVRWRAAYVDNYYGNGSNLTGINTDLVSDTSPQLGGDLDTNSNHILLNDTAQLKMGASNDFIIRHNGTDNTLGGNATTKFYNPLLEIYKLDGTKKAAAFNPDGSQDLYYNNSRKLSTINEGVEIKGGLYPETNNLRDLGSTSKRWRNIYTNDLNLSNEGGSNDVDGTWGSYTIQEGAEDLFLVNKRNGKKYKFNLTEVS